MNNIFTRRTKLVSFLLALFLILGSFTPFVEAAHDLNNIQLQKISSEVVHKFSQEKYIGVIIYLNEQLDTDKVKGESRHKVVEELRETAEETQEDLIDYIEKQKSKGKVKEYTPYYIVNAIYLKATEKVIKKISSMKEVKNIYSNSKIEIDFAETAECKSLNYDEESIKWNIKNIGADKVWDDFKIDGRGVVVGILDSGVSWEHEALKEKWRGYNPNDPENPNPQGNWFDATSNKKLPYDDSQQCHGTHVAGTIVGQDNEGKNKIGVAPGAKWIAARALTNNGGFPNWLLAAGQWMLAPNGDPSLAPDIINNSWGGTNRDEDGKNEWYRGIVKAWRAAGILPVFASGNERIKEAGPGSIAIPANYPESFSVAAVDKGNKLASFSQRGPSPYEEDEIKPEISAPGVDIKSSIVGGYADDWSGTSMAAPHVSGVAALLLSANKSLQVDDLEKIITDTANPLKDEKYPESPNQGYGYGLVNAYDAVKSVMKDRGIGTIKGKVMAQSKDLKGPKIEHKPVSYVFEDTEVTVKARIKGDISIKDAQLLYKTDDEEWKSISMSKESGTSRNGIYIGTIPSEDLRGLDFVYKIKAVDYNENKNETQEFKAEKSFGIIPDQYETDFSDYPIGWIFGGDWEWGEATSLYEMYGKRNMVGTNLTGKYSSNTTSRLETPPIDLRNKKFDHVVLKLNHFRELDPYFEDIAKILVSTDNKQSWKELQSFGGQYNHYWETASYLEEIAVDLTDYIGNKNPVYIAFELKSGKFSTMNGWYLDKVKLVGTDNKAPNPPKKLEVKEYPVGVTLNWIAPWSGDVVGYKVYRSTEEDGKYECIGETVARNFIDKDVEEGQIYYYKVSAYDIFGNESNFSRKSSSIKIKELQEIVFFTDFEDNDGGFTTGGENSDWEWGEPTTVYPCEAFTGTKLWGTNLNGVYKDGNNEGYIETPEIELPEDCPIYLNFHSWIDTDNNNDYGEVLITEYDEEMKEWSSWHSLSSEYQSEYEKVYKSFLPDWIKKPGVWKEHSLKLRQYGGKKVKIQFVFYSRGENMGSTGWYIDDVLISCKKNKEPLDRNAYLNLQSTNNIEENKLQYNGTNEKSNEDLKVDNKEPKTIIFDNFKEIVPKEELNSNDESKTKDKEEAKKEDILSIPVDAKITIMGKENKFDRPNILCSARTNLIDGSYELAPCVNNIGEKLILRVEAYGYKTEEIEVEVSSDKQVIQDFVLEKILTGNIKGKLIDKDKGKPISGATIRIKEDSKIKPVFSDENGNFELKNVPEGQKTLLISKKGYDIEEKKVDINSKLLDLKEISLSKSKNISVEIGYDDGTVERGVVEKCNLAGLAGTAIRISPHSQGKLLGTNIYFTDNSYPLPGGNRIGIAIFEADENLQPGDLEKAPIFFEIERGKWNYLDLSSLNFSTGSDFFIATIQDGDWHFMPAVGLDEDTKDENRSFFHNQNGFYDISLGTEDNAQGTLMIRAVMECEIGIGKIINIPKLMYTNKESIDLEGSIDKDDIINVYNNEKKVKEVTTLDNKFSTNLKLVEGENKVVLKSVKGKNEIETDSVTIIKDTVSPIIKITSPENNQVFEESKIKVVGNIKEEHLDKVLVNNKVVDVDNDGKFTVEMKLVKGKNEIVVEAFDKAGNKSKEICKIVHGKNKPEPEIPEEPMPEKPIELESPEAPETPEKPVKESIEIEIPTDLKTEEKIKTESGEIKISPKAFDKNADKVKFIAKEEDSAIEIKAVDEKGQAVKIKKALEVKVKFEGKVKNKDNVTAILVKEDGTKKPVGGVYDEKTKTIKFLTNECGKFIIKEGKKEFKDTFDVEWAKNQIESMAVKGIIKGKPENKFDPNVNISRSEFATLVSRILKLNEKSNKQVPFKDIDKDAWYYKSVVAVYENELVKGKSETTFDPTGDITRQEMTKIIGAILKQRGYENKDMSKLNKFKDGNSVSSWAKEGALLAVENGIIAGNGKGEFMPKDKATRAETATILYRLYNLIMK